jgi:hypothetical protein
MKETRKEINRQIKIINSQIEPGYTDIVVGLKNGESMIMCRVKAHASDVIQCLHYAYDIYWPDRKMGRKIK